MDTVIVFVLIGLTTGSIYAMAGMGLVLTYKTTGFFNFAYGSVAALSALAFYYLHVQHKVQWPLAALICVVVFGLLVGLALELLTRSLVAVSPTIQVVASIGLLLTMLGIGRIWYGDNDSEFPSFLPTSTFRIAGFYIGEDQLIIMAFAAISMVVLALGLRHTRSGTSLRAVVDNATLLGLTGVSPSKVRRLAWILGSSFAAISGILLAPGLGLNVLLLTLLVVQAFGAAAIGRFSSITLTYVGGLAIGVLAALSTKYVATYPTLAGLPAGLPFIVLVLVLLATPRRHLTSRRLVPMLRKRESWYAPTPVRVAALCVSVLLGGSVPLWAGTDLPVWSHGLTDFIIFLSVGTLVRTSGQVSLCQLSFAAIGASTMGHLAGQDHVPWLVALTVAALVSVPIGALVAYPATKLPGVFLAVATLGFGVLMEQMFYTTPFMFGFSSAGLSVPRPAVHIASWNMQSDIGYFYVLLCFAVAAVLVVIALNRSRLGRLLRAMSDSASALESSGTNVAVLRGIVFAFTAGIASLAGALSAALFNFAIPNQFSSFLSLQFVCVAVIIVVGEPWYAVIAALTNTVLPVYLPFNGVDNYLLLIFGISAATFALQADRVPAVPLAVQRAFLRWQKPPTDGIRTDPGVAVERRRQANDTDANRPGLEIRGLTVRFGGVVAVNGIDLVAPFGQITGLIGPNGAGKSTTFEACSGRVAASAGTILFKSLPLRRMTTSRRSRIGLGRTFQQPELYETLTVQQNVALGIEGRLAGGSPLRQIVQRRRDRSHVTTEVVAALETVKLAGMADQIVGLLSTGQRRLVEIARCLAGGYDLLLMDEPSSGLDSHESSEVAEILVAAVAARGIGILLVEHDLQLVRATCETLYVMDFGSIVCSGSVDDVLSSDVVRRAYTGVVSPTMTASEHV